MTTRKTMRVAITGAAGQIGYALLFRIASGQMFGPDVDVELNLLELPQAINALEGVAMELDDCAFPNLKKITCTDQLDVAMDSINWALLVGAVPRKQGMERSDLLKVNGQIFGPQGKAINNKAAKDVRVLVVGNPCNTNCYIAMNNALDIPKNRFFAMTMLDENRAKIQLAKKAGVAVTEVSNVTIWGNHSATQYPDFFNAKINGRPASEVIKDHEWAKGEFISTVQQRGAAIIKARGLSSAASAANAIVDSVYRITHDTKNGDSFSVCRASQGEYGVSEGLIFSFPCAVKGGELKVVEGIKHNPFGEEKIKVTLDELEAEKATVKELGLV